MNGFLVVIRCVRDDLPVGLYATEEEAREAATKIGRRDLINAGDLFKLDYLTQAQTVVLMEFAGGRWVAWETLRNLDIDELAEAACPPSPTHIPRDAPR